VGHDRDRVECENQRVCFRPVKSPKNTSRNVNCAALSSARDRDRRPAGDCRVRRADTLSDGIITVFPDKVKAALSRMTTKEPA
jgi:hypothetical protein